MIVFTLYAQLFRSCYSPHPSSDPFHELRTLSVWYQFVSIIMLRCVPRSLSRRLSKQSIIITSRRFSSTSCTRMASSQADKGTSTSMSLPSNSYQLLSTSKKSGAAEDALYQQQIRDVTEWWSSPRFEGIKRPYSADDVVSKRGSLQQIYPSSLMARKLFNLLEERVKSGEPVHTSR